jgi:hypothetical protein
MKKILAACAVTLLTSGCATIINGSTQPISVTTDPVVGANCELKNSEGTWYITTPGNAVISRTKNDLNVSCTKDGYPTTAIVVPSKFHAATFGNIVAGGLIGVAVDASTGANFEYDTPVKVALTGNPNDSKIGETSAPAQATMTTAAVKPPGSAP